jgi:hypothetical protein
MAPSGGGAVDAMSGEPNMQGTRLAGGGNVELRGHFTADGGQGDSGGGGGGFGGQGANGYNAVGSGGGGYNSSLGISTPPNYRGNEPSPAYQEGDTFQPQGTRAFSGTPQQAMQSMFAMLSGRPAGNVSAQQPMQMAALGMAGGGISRGLDIPDAPDGQHLGVIAQLLGMSRKREQDANPGLKYAYNPDDQQYVQQQATGGLSDAHYNLGGYSDGGRLLRGPGDGVSDSIPAVIGKKQPARLADGEFVVPARIVSELGNGSTEAGARKLYAMMDRIQASRKNTVGKGKVAKNNRADKYLPA